VTHRQVALFTTFSATLIAAVSLAWLAIAVSSGGTETFDSAVRLAIHQWASPALTTIAQGITIFGSVAFIAAAFIVAVVAFRIVGWPRAAARLTWAMAGAVILENGLKYGFHRARPEPFFGAAPASYSFPSGHALFSTCFYFVLASAITERIRSRAMRALIRLAAALFVAAIGLSRIYLGFHYPSDILGGYLAAAILLGAIMSIERMNEIAKPKA
jgi:undecaprenyl-diphosphatase